MLIVGICLLYLIRASPGVFTFWKMAERSSDQATVIIPFKTDSSVSRRFLKGRNGQVSDETTREWKMLDERYQGMRGCAIEGDPVLWDSEKHVGDAVAEGW